MSVKGGADRQGTALDPHVKVGRLGWKNTRNAVTVIFVNTSSVSEHIYSLPRLHNSSMLHVIDKSGPHL